MQCVACARVRALARTGKRMAAKMAIIAITTSNSIKVKAERWGQPASWRAGRSFQMCEGFIKHHDCLFLSRPQERHPAGSNLNLPPEANFVKQERGGVGNRTVTAGAYGGARTFQSAETSEYPTAPNNSLALLPINVAADWKV